ncbi:MAG: hypothetical protein ACP5O6_03770 [Candidatus Baltobacteraceae bacterium]
MRNSPYSWRTIIAVAAVALLAAVVVQAAFSTMWTHGTSAGIPYNGGYGPGRMMPWMWGGMGAFWIFPVVGFLIVLVVLGFILANFSDNARYRRFPGSHTSTPVVQASQSLQQCSGCGRGLAPDWVACPYCGVSRTTAGQLQARPPSDGME